MCKALHYACFALTKMSPSREVLFLTCRVGGKDVVSQHWHHAGSAMSRESALHGY